MLGELAQPSVDTEPLRFATRVPAVGNSVICMIILWFTLVIPKEQRLYDLYVFMRVFDNFITCRTQEKS